MTLFAEAARLYAATTRGDAVPDTAGAAELLSALGYVQAVPGQGLATTAAAAEHEGRARLLALAARLDDVFSLSLPFAPGIHFVGALTDRAAFDLDAGTAGRVSVGGVGGALAAAFEGCMGEMAESLSMAELSADPRVLAAAALPSEADMPRAWLCGGLGLADDALPGRLPMVAARRADDGGATMLPADLVLRRRPARRQCPRPPDKNGVAAGATHRQATVAALLELVERDAIALWWFARRGGRRLAPDQPGLPMLVRTVAAARRDGTRGFWFLDLTADIGIPVLACCSACADGTAVVAGFAADPSLERAAARAFLEMCQMEMAQQLALMKLRESGAAAMQPGDLTWVRRYREHTVDACPLLAGVADGPMPAAPEVGDGQRLPVILERLRAAGFRAHVVDLTRPDLAIPVVRAVVPGLQSSRPEWVSPRLAGAAAAGGVDLADTRHTLAPI